MTYCVSLGVRKYAHVHARTGARLRACECTYARMRMRAYDYARVRAPVRARVRMIVRMCALRLVYLYARVRSIRARM